MAVAPVPPVEPAEPEAEPLAPVKRWLLEENEPEPEGPHEPEGRHREHPWWQVMCLTGVDYFSTLGYQPGIAAVAAGALSPIATLVLVLVTLGGALPIYRWVAGESAHGEGSLAMLRTLLSWWKGKLFILCLLGFAATDFIITITLSAADATAHIVENPFTPQSLRHPIWLTILLITLLGSIFLKGFREAIGIAVLLVLLYLLLNLVVIGVGVYELILHPSHFPTWRDMLFREYGSPFRMIGYALLLFP